jgi:hypothetical protein
MGFLWHYCSASSYEYYYTNVRITPHCLALEESLNILRVVLVVYLNWVNSVVYQVPLAYVTPLTLAVNSLGCLFQLILTLDAYRIKNHLQIFVQCVANICLSVSTVLQYGETRDAAARILLNHDMYGTPFADHDWPFWKKSSIGLMVCVVVTCACSAVMCGLARGLYREFSWALYQHVSPDKKTQNKYMVYQVSTSNTVPWLYSQLCRFILFFSRSHHTLSSHSYSYTTSSTFITKSPNSR